MNVCNCVYIHLYMPTQLSLYHIVYKMYLCIYLCINICLKCIHPVTKKNTKNTQQNINMYDLI